MGGAKLNRLRLKTNYKLMIWSLRERKWSIWASISSILSLFSSSTTIRKIILHEFDPLTASISTSPSGSCWAMQFVFKFSPSTGRSLKNTRAVLVESSKRQNFLQSNTLVLSESLSTTNKKKGKLTKKSPGINKLWCLPTKHDAQYLQGK